MYDLIFSHLTGNISVQVSPDGKTQNITHDGVTLWDVYMDGDWDLPNPVPESSYALVANLLRSNDCLPASCLQEEYDELISQSEKFKSNPFVDAYLSSYGECVDAREPEIG